MKAVDRWSVLALARFWLAFIVAVNHLAEFVDIGWLGFIPKFGAFEAILGFLLISGYSIGESYRSKPQGFYWRRIKRIYPIYLASIAVVFFVTRPELSPAFILTLAANILFLNQLVTSTSFVGPAWSLSLEVWLYALAPCLAKLRERSLAWLCLGSLVAYTAYTCGRTLFNWSFYAGLGFGLNLPTLAYMWVFGFWLSVAKDKARVLLFIGLAMAYITLLGAGIQVAFRIKNDAFAMVPGDLFDHACQGANLLIVWLVFQRWVVGPRQKGYRSKWMSFLGDVSYPLYLLHMPVFAYLVGKSFANAEFLLLASVVFSAAVYLALDVYSRRRHLRSQ